VGDAGVTAARLLPVGDAFERLGTGMCIGQAQIETLCISKHISAM